MRRRIGDSLLELKVGDITAEAVDAIVNAANSQLAGGGGVDGAIHRGAGPAVMEETRERYPQGCPTGSAVISGAGKLPARYIVHAVGPVWKGGQQGEPELLRSAWRTCLELATEHECESIAFPAISTGVYGYPVDRAAKEALGTVAEYLRLLSTPLNVRVVLFSEGAYGAFSRVLEEMFPDG